MITFSPKRALALSLAIYEWMTTTHKLTAGKDYSLLYDAELDLVKFHSSDERFETMAAVKWAGEVK